MTTLWLARHAAVLAPAGLCYGSSELPADPAATQAAAAALHEALPPRIRVACSPLGRCLQLAEALRRWRPQLHWEIDPRLAEMDFGSWEGRSWEAIGQAAVQAWTDDFAQHRPGGGEAVQDMLSRVGAAWREACSERDADVLWITHAGVIRAVLLLQRGLPSPLRAADWPADSVPPGSLHRAGS